MVHEDCTPGPRADWPFANPKPFLQWGLGLCGVVFLLYTLPIWVFHLTGMNLGRFVLVGNGWTLLQVLLLAAGILAVGAAVTTRPKSPAVLALAALGALVACWGMNPAWDTARLVMGLLVLIALFANFLLLLPLIVGKLFAAWEFTFCGHRNPDVEGAETRGRLAGWVLSRAIIVVLVLLHFVGIASAIMAVPPRDREPSWLSRQLFMAYQPYLQFLYLNNAYRFYSPEPGPPTLLWFHIEYADGSSRWLKLPSRAEHAKDPLGQEFTRRLSIGESVSQMSMMVQTPDLVKQKRIHAGTLYEIPLHPMRGIDAQYALPNEGSRRLLGEYARYVAQHTPSQKDPNLEVRGVKIYRVIHWMLAPNELADEGPGRQEPTDDWTYLPYYQGDYDRDGRLKDPEDPFLFWLIPIYRWPRGMPMNSFGTNMPPRITGDYDVYNYLEKHARLGSTKEDKQP